MRTTEQYKYQLSQRNPSILVIGEYTGNHQKIKVQCLECGRVFESCASSLLRGHGCKYCNCEKKDIKQRMSESEFKRRLFSVNSNLQLLSDYKGSMQKVKVRCLVCGNEYETYASNLLHGYGCMKCYKNSRFRSKEDFIKAIELVTDTIIVGDDYQNGKTPCEFTCKICGYKRRVRPNNFLASGCRCPKCDGNAMMSPDEYKDLVISKGIVIPLGEYSGVKNSLRYQCSKCKQTWEETPEVFAMRNYTCKYCERGISQLEDKIKQYFISHNIVYEVQKKFNGLIGIGGKPLFYDFFVPGLNLLIEAQGKQHFVPIPHFGGDKQFQKQVEHDKRKKSFALSNGFNFLEVLYKDEKNIETVLDDYFDHSFNLKAIS